MHKLLNGSLSQYIILQRMEGRKELEKNIKNEHFNANCANVHCNNAREKVVEHVSE